MRSGRPIISDQAALHPVGPRRLRLLVAHRTSYHFPSGAARLHLLLRLWPEPHAGQVVRKWSVSVDGQPVQPGPRTGHGDRAALWSAAAGPGSTVIEAAGIVETEDRTGLVSGLTVRPNPAIFLRATERTRADKAVAALMAPPRTDALIAWLHELTAVVHLRLPYLSGLTTIETTAIEALKAGCGVCQDHTHLFIAVARAHGVPARYVCGYLLAGDGGEGTLHETHAWAEAWVEGLGWVAFDPTSRMSATERYVRLSTGLDAFDAAPIRGHAIGGSATGMRADVRIMPSGGQGPQESAMEEQLRARQLQNQQQQQQ